MALLMRFKFNKTTTTETEESIEIEGDNITPDNIYRILGQVNGESIRLKKEIRRVPKKREFKTLEELDALTVKEFLSLSPAELEGIDKLSEMILPKLEEIENPTRKQRKTFKRSVEMALDSLGLPRRRTKKVFKIVYDLSEEEVKRAISIIFSEEVEERERKRKREIDAEEYANYDHGIGG